MAVGVGRLPNVEVRKMKSQEQEEISQKRATIYSSPEKNAEIMYDVPERADDQTNQNESPLQLPIDMAEDSWEHKLPLCLFCYGVRHH